MQTRFWSFVETMTNIAIGFVIALLSQLVIFHFYDIQLSLGSNLAITGWFTAVSIVRSYVLRRFFNRLHGKRVAR